MYNLQKIARNGKNRCLTLELKVDDEEQQSGDIGGERNWGGNIAIIRENAMTIMT